MFIRNLRDELCEKAINGKFEKGREKRQNNKTQYNWIEKE